MGQGRPGLSSKPMHSSKFSYIIKQDAKDSKMVKRAKWQREQDGVETDPFSAATCKSKLPCEPTALTHA